MTNNIRRFIKIVAMGLGLALMSTAASATDRIKVLDPGIKHFGKSYNQLAGDWYNWQVQFPLATNPVVEDGAVDCTRGQAGQIWFLAGNFGGTSNRECTIPKGKALFFPIINTLWWFPDDGPNVDVLRAIAIRPLTLQPRWKLSSMESPLKIHLPIARSHSPEVSL